MLIGVPIISLSRKIHFCSCKFHTRHCIAEIVFAATENVLERFQLTFQAQVQYVCTVPELTLDVFADVLAPNGTKPSTGTILGEKSLMFSSHIFWPAMIPYHISEWDDVIENDQQNLAQPHGTSSGKLYDGCCNKQGNVMAFLSSSNT